jgi:uncharacterized membrane protein YqhA
MAGPSFTIGITHVATSTEQLGWKVGLHMTFVVSGVLFAVMDRLTTKAH